MSASAESNGTMNGHAAGTAVLERVKQAREVAAQNGEKLPGRDTLADTLGISRWQAQQALKELKDKTVTTPQPPPVDDQQIVAPTDGPEGTAEAPEEATPSALQQGAVSPPPRPWPLLLIGLAAAVAVWSGWVGLGAKCGFGVIQPLPGIADGFHLNTAITLPISVEAYAAYALRVWLSNSRHSSRTITFAKWSTVISLLIGWAAQAGFHLLEAFGYKQAPWPVVLLVSSVPVVMVGLASGLAKLVKDDRQAGQQQ